MKKSLSEMTLEELWQLFPIFLVKPDPQWKIWYAEERERLLSFLPDGTRVSHIGSTAIDGIWAKNIVEILIELPKGSSLAQVGELMEKYGYGCFSKSEKRMSFQRGYTEEGFAERVFHLHLRLAGDNDELYFRDFLNAHRDSALAYEKLKLNLWKQYEHDRDAYTAAKGEFVKECTRLAKQEFAGKY